MQDNRDVLVLGGAGFIGSHLCYALVDLGENVLCLDNLQTGNLNNFRQPHKSNLMINPKFQFLRWDITREIPLDNLKAIFNLACPASPPRYQQNAAKTLMTCVQGTKNMLDLAKEHNIPFIQASTSEIYGDPKITPQSESYWGNVNCYGPRACYDEGKRAAESMVYTYSQEYDVQTSIVRIFNTYGPHMDPLDGRVISNFIVQSLMGDDVKVYGDGNQTRSFCFVSDLVNGLIQLYNEMLRYRYDTRYNVINLGNPETRTINEIADIIIRKTNSRSKVIHVAPTVDDPSNRCPDISKATTLLNWKPTIGLDEGLDNTIKYFQNLLNKNDRYPSRIFATTS